MEEKKAEEGNRDFGGGRKQRGETEERRELGVEEADHFWERSSGAELGIVERAEAAIKTTETA